MTVIRRALQGSSLAICALVGTSCGDSAPALGSGTNVRQDAGSRACREDDTQPCDCPDAEGEQVCSSGRWGACDCGDGEQVTGDGDGDGDGRSGGQLHCKAGYYVGTFKGGWKPGIGDIPPLGTLIKVTITASDQPDKPGLALTLEEQSELGGEFPVYSVKNGCLVGTASSGEGQNHPFIGTITGSLSCETGKFEGHVDGYYKLFGEALGDTSIWYFAGSMDATFDLGATSLKDGTWDLREKQSTAPDGPGGKAEWQATWQSAEGPALPPECQELLDGRGDAGVGESP